MGRLQNPHIFAKVNLLLIYNDSENKKVVRESKLLQIPWKLMATLFLSTSYNA